MKEALERIDARGGTAMHDAIPILPAAALST
jgi:hypothetical protein